MNKQTRIAVIYSLSFLLTCSSLLFAEESITITTYYPSPYGSYNELQTNRLAVGDTSGDDQLTSADQPSANGQIYTARSVIFKPQSSLPASDVREGEVVYDDSTGTLRYYDGSSWQAGGVVSFTYYCFFPGEGGDAARGTPVCTNHGGEQGFCPSAGDDGSGGLSGLKQKASLGSWGGCGSCGGHGDCPGGIKTFFLPPAGSCGVGFTAGSAVVGSAYVCSQ